MQLRITEYVWLGMVSVRSVIEPILTTFSLRMLFQKKIALLLNESLKVTSHHRTAVG